MGNLLNYLLRTGLFIGMARHYLSTLEGWLISSLVTALLKQLTQDDHLLYSIYYKL